MPAQASPGSVEAIMIYKLNFLNKMVS